MKYWYKTAVLSIYCLYLRSQDNHLFSHQTFYPNQINVRVNNGETLLIGGLIFDTADEMNNKVPVLGDIPIIRRLFNYSNKTKEQRELLIFITPTVVLGDA